MRDFLNRDFVVNFVKLNKKTIIKVAVGAFVFALAFFVFVGRNGGGEEFELIRGSESNIGESAEVSAGKDNVELADKTPGEEDEENKEIYVDISGAVNKPSVYKLHENARMYELVKMAGGLREDASTENINLAKLLNDQEKIVVYTNAELEEKINSGEVMIEETLSTSGFSKESGAQGGKININTASSAELQNLKGVGPSMAEKIISYRSSNGSFRKIEDLMNVKGIGNKTFDKFKENICI